MATAQGTTAPLPYQPHLEPLDEPTELATARLHWNGFREGRPPWLPTGSAVAIEDALARLTCGECDALGLRVTFWFNAQGRAWRVYATCPKCGATFRG